VSSGFSVLIDLGWAQLKPHLPLEDAELKRRLPPQAEGKSWIERIAGTFKDDPDFDDIVRLGREFRQSVQ